MSAALSISAVTVGFIAYHFITQSVSLRKFFEKKYGEERSKVTWIYFQRMVGVFFYGVVPAGIAASQNIDFQAIGWNFDNGPTTLLWVLGLGVVVTVMNYFAARSDDNLAMYPQVRVGPPWPKPLLFGSALTWIAYLLAYEFLFRGYLLFTCFNEFGTTLAIVINVSLYALVHVPKGWKETLGAVPLGIVLCLLTLQTGNIWIAVGVHVSMALGNEWWSLYYSGKSN